jgi:hypothetical protein
MQKRVKLTVEMDVTVPQGLALQAMFKHWNRLASQGSSRMVAFYVDGDGNFKPKCQVSFSEEMPALTPELEAVACVLNDDYPERYTQYQFDFDPIAWHLKNADYPELMLMTEGENLTVRKVSDATVDQIEQATGDPGKWRDGECGHTERVERAEDERKNCTEGPSQ